MKKLIYTLFFASAATMAFAQPELPAPSPKAMVMQTAGLTEITIDYSSPGVKGRTIWGDVVPYGELWRTGANASTKITFSRNVKIADKDVPAGTYSIFIIPNKDSWTFILNKNAKASTSEYKKEEDLLRMDVKPQTIPSKERMAFSITDFDNEKATINLEWATSRISIPVKLNTNAQAVASIESAVSNSWRPLAYSARYFLDNNMELDKAAELINTSISLNENWFNVWIKAQLLNKQGKKAEALEQAKKAKELGDKAGSGFFYKSQVEKAIQDWS